MEASWSPNDSSFFSPQEHLVYWIDEFGAASASCLQESFRGVMLQAMRTRNTKVGAERSEPS